MNLDVAGFKNDVGELKLHRFLMTTTDMFNYDGRSVTRTRRVAIEGFVKRGDTAFTGEGPEDILSERFGQVKMGGPGTLTLPHTTLNNIRIESFEYGEGLWIEFMPVSIVFVDDYPDRNNYTMQWFGLTLHQPRLLVPVATAKLLDEYAQMPWQNVGMLNYSAVDTTLARTRTPTPMMEMSLTGVISLEDADKPGTLPDDLIQKLIQRSGVTRLGTTPPGYPIPFSLAEACPQMADRLPLIHIIVTGGSVTWDVENEFLQVQLGLLCQPQRIVVEK